MKALQHAGSSVWRGDWEGKRGRERKTRDGGDVGECGGERRTVAEELRLSDIRVLELLEHPWVRHHLRRRRCRLSPQRPALQLAARSFVVGAGRTLTFVLKTAALLTRSTDDGLRERARSIVPPQPSPISSQATALQAVCCVLRSTEWTHSSMQAAAMVRHRRLSHTL